MPPSSRPTQSRGVRFAQSLKNSWHPFRIINRFLEWKERHGTTIVHSDGCSHSHLQRTAKCKCPKRLAFKTVDSYIGKLRAIFKETGRCGEWNSMLGLGNPAASPEVQKYLKASCNRGTIASPHHTKASSLPILSGLTSHV